MQPDQFDPTADHYEDDHDARRAVWEELPPHILPEDLGGALAWMLRLHEAFNEWVGTPPGGGYSISAHQLACWSKASDLEALACKSLLEWHLADGEMDAAIRAIVKCGGYYEACMKPSRLN